MTQEELRIFAEGRGLHCLGPTIMGRWGGYPFLATLKSGHVSVLTASFSLSRSPSAKALRLGRKELPKSCVLTWQNGKINLVCSARDELLTGLFQEGMDTVARLFRENGAVVSSSCALCHREGADGLALVDGSYAPVHRTCCEGRSYETVARAEANNLSGSYLTGWIGALLGGIVGALPTIIVGAWMEFISLWLCLLVPLGAYFGYKLCRGRMDRMATVATVVSALVQVFVVEQAMFYIAIVRYWGIWPSIFASISYYFSFEVLTPGDALAEMVKILLFMAVGIFCVFGIIRRTNRHETQEAGVMVDSLTDLDGRPIAQARPVQEPVSVSAVSDPSPAASAPGASQPTQKSEDSSAWYEEDD